MWNVFHGTPFERRSRRVSSSLHRTKRLLLTLCGLLILFMFGFLLGLGIVFLLLFDWLVPLVKSTCKRIPISSAASSQQASERQAVSEELQEAEDFLAWYDEYRLLFSHDLGLSVPPSLSAAHKIYQAAYTGTMDRGEEETVR